MNAVINRQTVGNALNEMRRDGKLPPAAAEFWLGNGAANLNAAKPKELEKLAASLGMIDPPEQPQSEVNVPAKDSAPNLNEARRLHAAGLKLCKLVDNTKQPVGNDWQRRPVATIDDSATGYGLLLAANARCSIDPDQVDMARITMDAWGFDLDALMTEGARTISTRPGSGGRSMFQAADGLGWVKFGAKVDGVNVTVLELRANSTNLQDVVPGLIYGAGFAQYYAPDSKYRYDNAPALPPAFFDFWLKMSTDMAYRAQRERVAVAALASAGHKCDVIHDLSGGKKLPFPEINGSLRAKFNTAVSVESILLANAYEQHGDRFLAPGGTGQPGIRAIPLKNGLWQSDHGSDPLKGTFDATTAAVVLQFGYSVEAFEEWCLTHAIGEAVAKVEFGGGAKVGMADLVKVAAAPVGVPKVANVATHPLADFSEAEPEGDMRDGEFVLDYLIAAGMVLVAGAPGVGKTTQLIPLMTIVAHACPPEHELLPELRRNVIYITEDPAQARNIIASLRDSGWFGALSKRDVGERFKIVTAKRLSSEMIAEVSSIYLAMGVTNTNPETGDTHVAHPVVVFDTTSATIELDNENDNAEVGSAVASLKENFASKGIPVILVAHIAKNLNRADVGELSVRGASAWIGDVQQVTFLLKDNDDENKRWLEIAHPVAKHRFEPMGDGIEFDLCTRTIHSTSVLGRVRDVKRSHGVPKLIIRGQRLIEKRARADFNKTAAANALVGNIRSILQAHQEKADICYMTKNEVAKEVGGCKATILATIDKMVEDNILEFADFAEFPKRHHTHTVGFRVRVVGF